MPLYPFTSVGVQAKLSQLYALSDEALLLEAMLIETNFKNWMEDNFILDVYQKAFLQGIKEEAVNYYGSQCAVCFRYRLAIVLDYPAPPATPGYVKWPETTNTIAIRADNKGNVIARGSLTFTMTYE